MKMWAYVGFIALVMVFLALDLGVFHREAHEVSLKESMLWSAIWLTCGLSFAGFVYYACQFHWLSPDISHSGGSAWQDFGRQRLLLTEAYPLRYGEGSESRWRPKDHEDGRRSVKYPG